MTFDSRWKDPQGKSLEHLHDAIVQIVRELRKGDYLPAAISDAEEVDYDNATSGLTADNVQDAIDENDARLDALEASGGWTLIEQRTVNGDEVFTDLEGYNELRVVLAAVTASSSGTRQLQVSIDNGANFLTSSGDYIAFQATNAAAIDLHRTAASTGVYCECTIHGSDLTEPKTAFAPNGLNTGFYIPTTSIIDALRVINSAGNPNGGEIYLFGR